MEGAGYLKRSVGGAALVVLVALNSACSIGMALSGDPEPDLAACHVGAEEVAIEEELGPPVQTRALPDGGRECVYEYALGTAPSSERAITYGALDVLTFGLWEAIGTPVEALQGETYRMTVTYDAAGNATAIATEKVAD
jgi:hypothetical protein